METDDGMEGLGAAGGGRELTLCARLKTRIGQMCKPSLKAVCGRNNFAGEGQHFQA